VRHTVVDGRYSQLPVEVTTC